MTFNGNVPDNVASQSQLNVFSLNPVTPDSNAVNGGVSYVELNKPNQSAFGTYKVEISLKDANASNGSLTATPSCLINVNVATSNLDVWRTTMRTSFNPGPVIDCTATVVAQISPTEFTVENIVGDNVQNQAGGFLASGPILDRQGQSVNLDGTISGLFPNPQGGATIKDVSSGSVLGKVEVTNYNTTPEEQSLGNFGTTATVTTQANLTVTPGQAINFSCGRWDVSMINGHNIFYAGKMHANSVIVVTFPYPDDPSTWVYTNLFRCSPPNNPTVPTPPVFWGQVFNFVPLYALSGPINPGTSCSGGS